MNPTPGSESAYDDPHPPGRGPASIAARRDVWAIVFALTLPTVVTYAYFVALADRPAWLQYTTYGVGKTIQFGFPLFWVCMVQSQRLGIARPDKRGMGMGTVFGVLVLVGMLVIYSTVLKPFGTLDEALVAVADKIAGLRVDTVWQYVVMAAFYSVIHAFLEEYYWRWFVFGQLRKQGSLGMAIVVSSLGFMAHHVLVLGFYFGWLSPATYLLSAAVAVGGAFWAWLYERSGSLYAPWVSHGLVDVAIFLVGYDMVRDQLV
jgi:membrane protease YdiL (CAAX protease family)